MAITDDGKVWSYDFMDEDFIMWYADVGGRRTAHMVYQFESATFSVSVPEYDGTTSHFEFPKWWTR